MPWPDEDRRLVIVAAEELEDYLNSKQLIWRLSKSAGTLTPGNLLLSLRRGHADISQISDQKYLSAAEKIKTILEKRLSVWEKKIAEEIPYRIRLWQNAIEDYSEDAIVDASIKAQIKNRVIIEILMDEARIIHPRDKNQVEVLDNSFKRFVKSGTFLWDKALANVFPIEKFWYLYLQTGVVKL